MHASGYEAQTSSAASLQIRPISCAVKSTGSVSPRRGAREHEKIVNHLLHAHGAALCNRDGSDAG